MKVIGDGGHAAVVRELPPAEGTLVAIGDNRARKRVVEAEKGSGPFATLIHPTAWVSPTARLGEGSVIMAGAIVQAGAVIGAHCIINTGASVDHHCIIEDFVHIAPGARLCGAVRVGEGTLVGVGVGIAPGAVIPAWSLVKARRLEIEPIPGD